MTSKILQQELDQFYDKIINDIEYTQQQEQRNKSRSIQKAISKSKNTECSSQAKKSQLMSTKQKTNNLSIKISQRLSKQIKKQVDKNSNFKKQTKRISQKQQLHSKDLKSINSQQQFAIFVHQIQSQLSLEENDQTLVKKQQITKQKQQLNQLISPRQTGKIIDNRRQSHQASSAKPEQKSCTTQRYSCVSPTKIQKPILSNLYPLRKIPSLQQVKPSLQGIKPSLQRIKPSLQGIKPSLQKVKQLQQKKPSQAKANLLSHRISTQQNQRKSSRQVKQNRYNQVNKTLNNNLSMNLLVLGETTKINHKINDNKYTQRNFTSRKVKKITGFQNLDVSYQFQLKGKPLKMSDILQDRNYDHKPQQSITLQDNSPRYKLRKVIKRSPYGVIQLQVQQKNNTSKITNLRILRPKQMIRIQKMSNLSRIKKINQTFEEQKSDTKQFDDQSIQSSRPLEKLQYISTILMR